MLDRLLYQNAKKELIWRSQDDHFPNLDLDLPKELAGQFMRAEPGPLRDDLGRQLREKFEELGRRTDWSIFRVRLVTDQDYRPLVSPSDEKETRARKMRGFNSFRNCLFIRQFESSLFASVSSPPLGWIEITWTTPRGDTDVESLTRRYRAIAAAVVAGVTVIFAGFFWMIILPMRRVSGAIENSLRLQPALLRRPGSKLERAYNNLARDALINRLQGQMREHIAQRQLLDLPELMDQMARSIVDFFRFPYVRILQPQPGASESALKRWEAGAHTRRPDDRAMGRLLAAVDLEAGAPALIEADEGGLRLMARAVQGAEGESPLVVVVGCEPSMAALHRDWLRETVERLAEELGRAVGILRQRQEQEFQQRSDASINLAENLGHDLTNIIAGARLDLATLRQILEKDAQEIVDSPRLRDVMKEAIGHLIANARFLQEIVNIYRAFTNLRRPRYEDVDLSALASEVGTLFQNSISAQIHVDVDADPAAPRCNAEPRLVKLALFNLLTNAADAIKASQADGGGAGRIRIRVRHDSGNDLVWIAVRDDGRGILNAGGQPAGPEEIERIFGLGYSTKKDDISEGLGLSWVKSIVTEFHHGRLEARNLKEGGAEFCLALPLDPAAINVSAPSAASPNPHNGPTAGK